VFADVYIAAADAAHQADSLRLLLPNVSFCLAIMLHAIFRFHPPSDDAAISVTPGKETDEQVA
jgi:hypothetical protein